MQYSKLNRPARVRQVAICALAALLTGTAAHAGTRWWRLRPHISGTPATTDAAGQAYSFTPTASGPSGYTLKFAISGKPAWASFSTTTGTLSGTPTTANVGTFSNIVISVSDGVAKASLAPFSITVSAPSNTAPSISGTPPTSATAGTAYTFTPSASDTDGDTLSFSVQNMPAWASFSTATGTLAGTPTSTSAGTYSNIVISVSDGHTSASLAPFSITVNPSSSSGSGSTGTAAVSWTAPTTNSDGSALTDLAGYHVYYGTSP
ncbi:MAG: putative Ig domain-containing protein, partial [Gammaproteobacteria bacterium]|nr:putative Ig domain-containing protein [Gammaproteobacteria bacterium]